jgi:8-amino-7-oxononanoate synthase
MDVFAKAGEYTLAKAAIASGIYPRFSAGSPASAATLNGGKLLMFGSCNYLGLGNHDTVKAAVREAMANYGTCSAGSRVLSGNLDLHLELESRLRAYLDKEACLVFTTGYQASEGTISALVRGGDVVILDEAAHASCVDGARLASGTLVRFPHNDTGQLEHLLRRYCPESGVLVVVDGVYSMTGDVAPLREIAELKRRYSFRLFVDDAHGIGVIGAGGRGTCEYLGVLDEVDLLAGSFGKSFGTTGGLVAGPSEVIDFIKYTASSLVESTSMTPGNAAAVLAALDVSVREPYRRSRAVGLARRLREDLRGVLGSSATVIEGPAAIVSIVIGDELATLCFWRRLYDEGLYVNPMIVPVVPPGKASLRISCTADHSEEDIQNVVAAFRRAGSPAEAIARAGLGESEAADLARLLGR